MAKPFQKKHAWDKVRFRTADGLIEVYEHKPAETVCVFVLLFGPVVAFLWIYLAMRGTLDQFLLVFVGIVLSTPVLATLAIYRPPRLVRIYPDEQVVHVSRRYLAMVLRGKWHDLEHAVLRIEHTRVESEEAGGGAATIGCLLMLAGPIGAIISLLAMRSNKHKQYDPAYALVIAGSTGKPLALFLRQADAQRLMALYESVQH